MKLNLSLLQLIELYRLPIHKFKDYKVVLQDVYKATGHSVTIILNIHKTQKTRQHQTIDLSESKL